MNVLIFCALEEEARPILKIIRSLPQGTCSYRLRVTGSGRKNIQRAWADRDKDFPPNLVMFCGFAGGLNPRLDSGKLILVDKILLWEGGSKEPLTFTIDGAWFKRTQVILSDLDPHIFCGAILTVPRVISKASEKRTLGIRCDALAVDMESGYLAQLLVKDSIPFIVLRVISDSVEESLNIDFSPWIDRKGKIRKGSMFLNLVRHPSKIQPFYRLARIARKGRKRLALAMKKILLTVGTGN